MSHSHSTRPPSRRQELGAASTIRFGLLGASDISVALTAFVR